MTYDLAIAYRIYPGNPKIPAIVYPCDKYNLSRICFYSLVQALGSLRTKFYIILDSCPHYESIFREFLNTDDILIDNRSNAGNSKTFELQLDWLCSQTYSSNVFLAEDDYLYRPACLSLGLKFLSENLSSSYFFTPYDHPDYYTLRWHSLLYPSSIIVSDKHTLISRASTTCTFMTTQQTLISAQRVLLSYRYLGDIGFWYLLTARNTLDLIRIVLSLLNDKNRYIASFMLKSLLYKFLFMPYRHHQFILWACTPSMATHTESEYLSDHVNWHELVLKYQSELSK
jgi:hypothetical protein